MGGRGGRDNLYAPRASLPPKTCLQKHALIVLRGFCTVHDVNDGGGPRMTSKDKTLQISTCMGLYRV